MEKQIDDNHYMIGRVIDGSKVIEYFTRQEQRHRKDGPAKISIVKNNELLEWWESGKLIATFNRDKNLMLKSNDGKHTGLYEVKVPKKWKGIERALTVDDILTLSNPAFDKASALENVSKIREQSKPSDPTQHSLKFD